MSDALKQRVLGWLRIPLAPHIPPGEAEHSELFRAGKPFYTYQLLRWGFKQVIAWIGLLAGFLFLHVVTVNPFLADTLDQSKWTRPSFLFWIEVAGALFLIFELPISYLMVRWDYECRFYLLTDRCLRIQEGLWSFREQTFTLANVQNIDLRQNPVQRFFGISDVVIRTAGGGGGKGPHGEQLGADMHTGTLRGVSGGDRIRDRLLAQMKTFRDTGLGDEPSHPVTPHPAAGFNPSEGHPALRTALAQVLEESRRLRELLTAEGGRG